MRWCLISAKTSDLMLPLVRSRASVRLPGPRAEKPATVCSSLSLLHEVGSCRVAGVQVAILEDDVTQELDMRGEGYIVEPSATDHDYDWHINTDRNGYGYGR